jgi:RNA-directed DNA polymerase
MASLDLVARALASAFLAGEWSNVSLARRGAIALGERPAWLRKLVQDVTRSFPNPPSDERDVLAAHIRESESFDTMRDPGTVPKIRRFYVDRPAMGRGPWNVPNIPTSADLASFLGLTLAELDRFADTRGVERDTRHEAVRHYRYRVVIKPSGGARVLEAPKDKLKRIQRHILENILNPIDPHPAAHGFVRGRSVLSFAKPHAKRSVVLRLDLEDFFGSVFASRVFGVYRSAGYPEIVARCLTALCTNRAPAHLLEELPAPTTSDGIQVRHRLRRHLATPHLPQGAPTSPALANLCAFGLDVRLSRLARAAGATYTRYADDLAFSSDRSLERLLPTIREIVAESGFRVRADKTRIMTRGMRQELAGMVVNEGVGVARDEVDRLKATLFNAGRWGPGVANREEHPAFREHLRGRIAWIRQVRPEKAARLERLFARIAW